MIFTIDLIQTVIIGGVLAIVMYQSLGTLNIYRVCGHLLVVETLLFKGLLIPFLFMGTFHGMTVGVFACLFLSMALRIRRHFYGYTYWNWQRRAWIFIPSKYDDLEFLGEQ